ncbi:MAG: sugar ABC transporter substrate-binding protein, partial [Tritonibacter mobilis]|nr:sugar ABC transporter substrate-binding protein [Tritonibacter mobilis]
MSDSASSNPDKITKPRNPLYRKRSTAPMNAFARHDQTGPVSPEAKSVALGALSLLEELSVELEDTLDVYVPNAHLRMA